MDATNDPLPHPEVTAEAHVPDAMGKHGRKELSIWFFCGILTLAYGTVLVAQGLFERFGLFGQHQPGTVLANLEPTLWWGAALFVFGAFYTIRFRPGKIKAGLQDAIRQGAEAPMLAVLGETQG